MFDWGTWLTDGKSIFIVGSAMQWKDSLSDPRLSGVETDTMESVFDAATMNGLMWGNMHVTNSAGWWEGNWHGTSTPFVDSTGPHTFSEMVATLAGGGGHQGLVARLRYTAVDGTKTGVFYIDGYIVEADGGPADRPLQVRATRVDRLTIQPCVVIMPPPADPTNPVVKLVGKIETITEVAQNSHLGRCSNQGVGLLDPETGTVSATGTVTAANGDLLYWVMKGTLDLETGNLDGAVRFAGGTGRLEAVTGGFGRGFRQQTLEPTEDPMVVLVKATYGAKGTIRY